MPAERVPESQKWKQSQANWCGETVRQRADRFTLQQWDHVAEELAKIVLRHGLDSPRGRAFRLLDVGCGQGSFYGYLRPVEADYIGLEPSPRQLDKVDARILSRVVAAQAEYAPIQDRWADVILLKSVLDQCYNPEKVLHECRRMLKPGGILLCSLPNRGSWYKVLLSKRAARAEAEDPDHLFFFDVPGACSLFEKARFQVKMIKSYAYLRLPAVIGNALVKGLGVKGVQLLLRISDRIGSRLLPRRGGVLVVLAMTEPENNCRGSA